MNKTICNTLLICAIALGTTGCLSRSTQASGDSLAAIQIYDRNGVQETISNRERTVVYEKNDYLEAQPYKKVIRTFEKGKDGMAKAKITTYHDNGQIWQYLETVNGRSCGEYIEWHQNGKKRMQANVIEGVGDLNIKAQATWVFDGMSFVWDANESLAAEINYEKGKLEGRSVYYHPNSSISKVLPYRNDLIEGTVNVYDTEGELIGRSEYSEGKKDGVCEFKGNEYIPKREELFRKGELVSGKYWDFSDRIVSEIEGGGGIRPFYENGQIIEEREYVKGVPEGEVKTYRDNGTLETIYHISEGKKEGEEWCYYDSSDKEKTLQPMLHLNWHDDEIHGTVRTWYEDGILESEKEIIDNKKNGMLIAWYKDGSLMIVEEYENDKLVTGKYLKLAEDTPASRVIAGAGIATIYSSEGKFMRKIEYAEGYPKE